ncbi:carboxypeptidase 1 [Spirochaetia bacterium]|nr:carboxypeptidase 1 [Spirochaetia bacterium]
MGTEKILEEFRSYVQKLAEYRRVNSLLFWDSMQPIPRDGAAGRSRTRAFMAKEQFTLETGGEMKRYLDILEPLAPTLSDFDRALVRLCGRDYRLNALIPPALFEEYERVKAEAMEKWGIAYKAEDYGLFAPYLKKVIEIQKQVCAYYPDGKSNYDKLIRFYEEDVDTAVLDSMFAQIKTAILPLIAKITAKKQMRPEFLSRTVPVAAQRALCERLCRRIGLDNNKAMLYETTHPFSFLLNLDDVRFTTRYREGDFSGSIFSVMHEGGHSIYSLNIPHKLTETILGEGASPAFHESQSRFYENVIGRSFEFISYIYPDVQELLGEYIGDVSPEELYRGVNCVEPSFIRTEADELTYTLHIILRYEIEREFIDGQVDLDTLPDLWNRKMNQYFGLDVTRDRLGILQDIQWSAGRIGSFVSYALGNVYNAQILHTIKQDMDFSECIRRGDFAVINGYLRDKVHQYSSLYPPRKQLEMITGKDLDPGFFVRYLEEKFTVLYDL